MSCLLCGTLLHADNQRGLVCRVCKQAREAKNTRGTVIHVQYCSSCGYPYHPTDASIRHEHCGVVLASSTFSVQAWSKQRKGKPCSLLGSCAAQRQRGSSGTR